MHLHQLADSTLEIGDGGPGARLHLIVPHLFTVSSSGPNCVVPQTDTMASDKC